MIEASGGSQGQTKAALRRLIAADAHVIGAVLTKYDFRRVGYSDYGYNEYYNYGGHERQGA